MHSDRHGTTYGRRHAPSERGYSLTEALIVLTLLIVVLGGTLSLIETTAKIAPEEQERGEAIREAQVGLATMTRELRQALTVESNTPSAITVRTPVAGVPKRVSYDCTVSSASKAGTTRCHRQVFDFGGAVESESYPLDRLLSPDVFTYTLDDGVVEFVRVRIEVPASGERAKGLDHKIVLDDGFFLRNASSG